MSEGEINDDTIINLESSDGKTFQVPYKIVKQSCTLKNMLEDLAGADDESPIPIPVVDGSTLEQVIKYCTDMDAWDEESFTANHAPLFDIILAANFLEIKPLLDLGCKTVAHLIKGKTPEEIRAIFNIENEFTPEEEEKCRKENEWCVG